eukprot:scaffold20.g7751.t1
MGAWEARSTGFDHAARQPPAAGEAGSVWREDRLREFVFQARVLGLEDDPQVTALLAAVAKHTQALEELAQAQSDPAYVRPWWQDGEYDDARADSTNDQGVRAMRAGEHSAAFDCFTEAIRLCPTSPVYHANRAAAALKLHRPDIAVEDAAQAARRDPTYLRALLRGGQAHLQLWQPDEAERLFRSALELDAKCAAAARGLADAQELSREVQAMREAEAAAAAAGSRPALARAAVPEQEAAEQLLAATQMAEANPGLEAARCALVEALILVGRYADAAAACEGLLAGADRQYLEAEVLWRQGGLDEAAARLAAAQQAAPGNAKCADLLTLVSSLRQLQHEAELAWEDGVFQECIEATTVLLARFEPGAATGLYCRTLQQRAEAYATRGMHEEALADLSAALAADAAHAGCLRARAELHKRLGRYTDCFLDLQRLSRAAPGTPGLLELLEEAARLSLGRRGAGGGAGRGAVSAPGKAGLDALRTLGLAEDASAAQVRRAYLGLAARHHPDKWAGAPEEEQRAAEARFKDIQRAYELLSAEA